VTLGPVGRAWKDFLAFQSLTRAERAIVLYAEDGGAWPHFAPIVAALGRAGRTLAYLTSSTADLVLQRPPAGVRPFFIGGGLVRSILFAGLDARVMVMTTPDLQTYQLKRSRRAVHYVYVHHSIVSTHMAYRPGAFDHFDAVLCVGPHHETETRARETLLNLPPKTLVPHGYGRLDALMDLAASSVSPAPRKGHPLALVAPSWGERALLEACGERIVESLLGADFAVRVRPHPVTTRKRPEVAASLRSRFSCHPGFSLETDVAATDSLLDADLVVSDWSGAALEYAFARERPVLFVDVPRKVNDPEYIRLGIEPIEARIRGQIGEIVAPADTAGVAHAARRLLACAPEYGERIREARAASIYNLRRSGAAAADYIATVADRAGARPS